MEKGERRLKVSEITRSGNGGFFHEKRHQCALENKKFQILGVLVAYNILRLELIIVDF